MSYTNPEDLPEWRSLTRLSWGEVMWWFVFLTATATLVGVASWPR